MGVRKQLVAPHTWTDVRAFPRYEETGTPTTVGAFVDAARASLARRYDQSGGVAPPPRAVEADFWHEWAAGAARGNGALASHYANDVEGSLFAATATGCPLASSPWNLRRLPLEAWSLLASLAGPAAVRGVSTPMLYIGELFAHFAWHVEDAALFSISYAHAGDAKVWYGVGARDADALEGAIARGTYAPGLPSRRRARSALPPTAPLTDADRAATTATLTAKTTLVPPDQLARAGVRVRRAIQTAGTFVVTFPRAYHAGFCAGVHVGEAVNFAPPVRLLHALDAADRHRALHTPALVDVAGMVLARARALVEHAAHGGLPPACAKAAAVAWNAAAARVEWQVDHLTRVHGAVAGPVADCVGACAQCGSPPRCAWVRLAGAVPALAPADGCWSKKRWQRGDIVCIDCAYAAAAAAKRPAAGGLVGADVARTADYESVLCALGCGATARPPLAAALTLDAWLPTAGLTRLLGGDARTLRSVCDVDVVVAAAAAARLVP